MADENFIINREVGVLIPSEVSYQRSKNALRSTKSMSKKILTKGSYGVFEEANSRWSSEMSIMFDMNNWYHVRESYTLFRIKYVLQRSHESEWDHTLLRLIDTTIISLGTG